MSKIISCFFIPKLKGFQLFIQIFTGILVPLIILIIECLCKNFAYTEKSGNSIENKTVKDNKTGNIIYLRTIKIYEKFYLYDSLPSVLLSNNIWGLTFIPVNVADQFLMPIFLCYIVISIFTVVAYALSFFGSKGKLKFIRFEKILIIINVISTYLLLVILPKLGDF